MHSAIDHPTRDLLDRSSFSLTLAKQIQKIKQREDSYVIGIEGEWGSGKSSVINMTLLNMLHLDMEKLSEEEIFHGDTPEKYDLVLLEELSAIYKKITGHYIPPFNINYIHPDHYNRQISRESNNDPTLRSQLYRYFRLQHRLQTDPQNLIIHFKPWLIPETSELSSTFITEISLSIGNILGTEIEESLNEYANIINKIGPIAGIAAHYTLPGTGGFVSNFISNVFKKKNASLNEVKHRLEENLKKLKNQKLIVVIDDLDRLTPKETLQMFNLVKSLGNLPNIIYLLSYDRNVVTKHIKSTLGIYDGNTYLEKIVQYRRSLPIIDENSLRIIINKFIARAVEKSNDEIRNRFAEAWHLIAKLLIKTPRDAIRCGEWYERSYSILHDFTDPVDLFLLEVVNVKDSDLYSWIRNNLFLLQEKNNQDLKELKKVLDDQNIPTDVIKSRVLAYLFPRVANALGQYFGNGDYAYTSKHIRFKEFSKAYFSLSFIKTQFSHYELNQAIHGENPVQYISELITKSEYSDHGTELRINLLEAILEHCNATKPNPDLAFALLKESKRLILLKDKASFDIFAPNNLMRLSYIFIAIANKLSSEEFNKILEKSLTEIEDLSLVALFITRYENTNTEKHDNDKILTIKKEIIDLTIEKIQQLAENFELLNNAAPIYPVLLWQNKCGSDVILRHTRQLIKRKINFKDLAKSVLMETQSSHEGIYYQFTDYAKSIVEIPSLLKWAENIRKTDRHSDNIVWAERLLNAHKRMTNGDIVF